MSHYTRNESYDSSAKDATGVLEAESNAAAVIEAISKRELHTVRVDHDEEGGRRVLVVPEGLRVESLKKYAEEYAERPRRVEGTARLTTIQSFIDHVQRFSDGESAIFAHDDPKAPRLLAVFDYHETQRSEDGVRARFGAHRAEYAFPLSDEWRAWTGLADNLSQSAFAEFLEEHIVDILDPSQAGESMIAWAETNRINLADQATLMDVARGLALRVDQKVVQRTNLSTGEAQFVFQEEHSSDKGGPVLVPGGFVIAIPVFRSGDLFQLAVRLRYRHRDGRVTWTISPSRWDLVFQTAFNEAVEAVREGTELPVFYGKPEAA